MNIIEQIIELIEVDEYGKAVDILMERYDEKFHKSSNYLLAKGILWELLGNFPKANKNYINSLDIDSNNLISLQYLAQLLSKKGEYRNSKKVFQKLFQVRPEGIDPFNIKRGFLGFRYRHDDIDLLENFEIKTEKTKELKKLLLGLYNLSIFNLQLAIKYFEKVKNPTIPLEILKLIASYLYNRDHRAVNELSRLILDGKNDLFSKINELLQDLSVKNYEHELTPFSYKIDLPNKLIEMTEDIQGWLDYCEGNLLYQLSKKLAKKNRERIFLAEIGAFLGRSSVFITQGLKDCGKGVLFSIDPHEGIPYYHSKPTFEDYMENIRKAEVERFIQVKKGTSEEFSSKIDEEISMLFIDGDHTYNMVKKDFYYWKDKIEPEGYIVFHDAVLEGPFKIILEALESNQWDFLQMIGNIALIQKKKSDGISKTDLLTLLNIILLHINRQFHLNFMENDDESMKEQVIELLNKI